MDTNSTKLAAIAVSSLVPEEYKRPRLPIAIGESPDGLRYKVVIERGDRTLIDDYAKYKDNRDFQRNALIGAIGTAAFMASALLILKNPKMHATMRNMSKFRLKPIPTQPSAIDQIAGGLGPTALALGALGLMNSDRSKTDLGLAAAGALATYRASRGDASGVPTAVKAFALSIPVASAGLHYAGRYAEKQEGRKNAVTELTGAARYTAPRKLLALAEGTSIKDLRERAFNPEVLTKLRRGVDFGIN